MTKKVNEIGGWAIGKCVISIKTHSIWKQDRSETLLSKKAFGLAMEIFEISKKFPKEEMYSLTDQIRRSSRSVATAIAEAYRKRKYEAYFISKSSDGDMENTETRAWLDFAEACNYINKQTRGKTRRTSTRGRETIKSYD